MASIIVVLLMSVVIGFLATSSRMIWSFARDRGMPFYHYISKASLSHLHPFSPPFTKHPFRSNQKLQSPWSQ